MGDILTNPAAINEIVRNGIFAVLFVGLFVYVLKDTKQREKKYQEVIKECQTIIGVLSNQINIKLDEIIKRFKKEE